MSPSQRKALWALALLLPVPSLGSFMFLMLPATRGTVLGQVVYSLAKVWILILPLVWWRWVDKQPFSWSPLRQGGMLAGAGLGLLLGGSLLGAWYLFGHQLVDAEAVRQQMSASGTSDPTVYLVLAVYITLVNSLLEEYVWRWFVFHKFEVLWGRHVALVLAALGFTLHHIIVLRSNFDLTLTILGAGSVFLGGLSWSWCYQKYRSIWPGYLSHLIVDASIFWIGWQILHPA